jgi:oxygen-dependent protoporphyrinogen oxidase
VHDLHALLGVKGEQTFRSFQLWPKAIPQYDLTYGRYKDVMEEVERRNPGLTLAGSYRDGVAVGEVMVSGQDAAGRLIERLEADVAADSR